MSAVQAAEQPVQWTPPGSKIDVSSLRGKTVFYIDYDLSIPFEATLLLGFKQGATAAGVKVVAFDGKSQVSEWSRGIDEAIAQHASAILLGGFPQSLVGPALQRAKAAGIPVIDTHSADAPPGSPGISSAIVAEAEHSYTLPGKLEADYITTKSKGTADIGFIQSSDLQSSDVARDAFTSESGKVCPACKVNMFDVSVANWNQLQGQTQSILRANPNMQYIVPVFDGMAFFVIPGIIASGKQSQVKVVTFNATSAIMQDLGKGVVVAAEVGDATLWEGWGFADQTFRVLLGQQPLADINVPERLFDSTNIGSIDLSAQESTWYGNIDYQGLYKALWGLQ
jgi:ribose transport system substrate-binding protein